MHILQSGYVGLHLKPVSPCSICFHDVINTCHTNACLHLFCFRCLLQWSYIEPICPTCQKSFEVIYHSFKKQSLRATYHVPLIDRLPRNPEYSHLDYVRTFDEMRNTYRRERIFTPIEIDFLE